MKKIKFMAVALAVLFVFNTYALPRSKAVVIDASAAFGAAAATAAINGTTATTLFSGMTTSAATSAMTGLMGEYAVATGAASSGTALAASIGAGTVITAAGAIVLTAAAAFAVYKFIGWLREEKGLVVGSGTTSILDNPYLLLSDGHYFYLGSGFSLSTVGNGTLASIGEVYYLSDGSSFSFTLTDSHQVSFDFFHSDGSKDNTVFGAPRLTYGDCFLFPGESSLTFRVGCFISGGKFIYSSYSFSPSYIGNASFSLNPNSEFQDIPLEIPDGQAMVITGIENLPQDNPQAAADLIMQIAIDGNLSPTVTVEADPTVTPDPDPDPDPDPEPVPPPEDLPQNLPDLGDVLTSRFPFSIPWDIGRVLDFLSADPVAPHIEFQPFKGGLFGIPADSVSVDYDFSKHEDIAAFCRTFEIVGFCLLLAVGTKRLIWTA